MVASLMTSQDNSSADAGVSDISIKFEMTNSFNIRLSGLNECAGLVQWNSIIEPATPGVS
jgi:hypothetical protein